MTLKKRRVAALNDCTISLFSPLPYICLVSVPLMIPLVLKPAVTMLSFLVVPSHSDSVTQL